MRGKCIEKWRPHNVWFDRFCLWVFLLSGHSHFPFDFINLPDHCPFTHLAEHQPYKQTSRGHARKTGRQKKYFETRMGARRIRLQSNLYGVGGRGSKKNIRIHRGKTAKACPSEVSLLSLLRIRRTSQCRHLSKLHSHFARGPRFLSQVRPRDHAWASKMSRMRQGIKYINNVTNPWAFPSYHTDMRPRAPRKIKDQGISPGLSFRHRGAVSA